ncbi:unnamed protein product [Staurois parvus]|uniref:Uncharacterized protein n=1 Tax=Staurois parvus TaxID=386267 RepID=A0ABN9DJA3_9NEOB|nr:unnamed protein product [Staurois parvus]
MPQCQSVGVLPMESLLQGRTDLLETRALPEGPGSIGGPM